MLRTGCLLTALEWQAPNLVGPPFSIQVGSRAQLTLGFCLICHRHLRARCVVPSHHQLDLARIARIPPRLAVDGYVNQYTSSHQTRWLTWSGDPGHHPYIAKKEVAQFTRKSFKRAWTNVANTTYADLSTKKYGNLLSFRIADQAADGHGVLAHLPA